MEILGLGVGEWLFIAVIILVLFGPREMAVNARKFATWLRRVLRSDWVRDVVESGQEISRIPTQIMQDAALDDLKQARRELENEIGSLVPDGTLSVDAWKPSAPIPADELPPAPDSIPPHPLSEE